MDLPASSRRPGGGTSQTNTSTYSNRKVYIRTYYCIVVCSGVCNSSGVVSNVCGTLLYACMCTYDMGHKKFAFRVY